MVTVQDNRVAMAMDSTISSHHQVLPRHHQGLLQTPTNRYLHHHHSQCRCHHHRHLHRHHHITMWVLLISNIKVNSIKATLGILL
jgi:hypothetical protein